MNVNSIRTGIKLQQFQFRIRIANRKCPIAIGTQSATNRNYGTDDGRRVSFVSQLIVLGPCSACVLALDGELFVRARI